MDKMLIMLIMYVVCFVACTMQTSEKRKNSYEKSNNVDSVKITTTLGCRSLITNPLPDRWAVVPYWEYQHDEKGEVTNLNQYDIQFNSINECFSDLNLYSDSIGLPEIQNWTYVFSGIENFCSCGATQHIATPKIANYRLPSIGPYQLYYSFQTAGYAEKCAFDCFQLGLLILVNSDSVSARLIPVFYQASTQFTVVQRFFYLQKNTIKLWQYQIDEDSTVLKARTQLIIIENGEIIKKDF